MQDDQYQYLFGQISCLKQMILAVARSLPQSEFKNHALQSLEHLKIVAINSGKTSDEFLRAIDDFESWVLTVTATDLD